MRMRRRTQKRVQEAIKRELAAILAFEVRDERLRGLVISRVELDPQGRFATVYLDLDPSKQARDVLDLLHQKRGYFRSKLASRLDLRFTPALIFKPDEELAQARRVESLLRESAEVGKDA